MNKRPRGPSARPKSASPRSRPSARQRSPSVASLPDDWLAFLACLRSRGVRFLIVGGHALAVHGRPRFTEDIDIFVEPTRANAARVCAALTDFGFPALAGAIDAFSTPDRMATLGKRPLRIDVMTSISGVSFREAWRDRTEVILGGSPVAFIGERALRKNKLASGRPKDLSDLTLLDEGRTKSRK
jgi:hypothetical protein